jgi:hypothetical protein
VTFTRVSVTKLSERLYDALSSRPEREVCLLLRSRQARISYLEEVHVVPAAGSTEANDGHDLAMAHWVSISLRQ